MQLKRPIAGTRDCYRPPRRAYGRLDLLTIGFAGLQLLLVPFVRADQVLTVAVIGHVAAVVIVSSASAALLYSR